MSKYFPIFKHKGKNYILASRWNFIMIILLLTMILFFVLILKTTLQNIDEIKTNPLSYGAKEYGISSCSCKINSREEIVFTPDYAERRINLARESFNFTQVNLTSLE